MKNRISFYEYGKAIFQPRVLNSPQYPFLWLMSPLKLSYGSSSVRGDEKKGEGICAILRDRGSWDCDKGWEGLIVFDSKCLIDTSKSRNNTRKRYKGI